MAVDVITLALAKKYTREKITEVTSMTPFVYQGSVANYDLLPTTHNRGDVYTTEDTGDEYVWTGEKWLQFGPDKNYTVTIETNVNEYKNITSDFDSGTFSSNLSSYNPGNYIVKTYGGTTYVAVLADYNYFYNSGRSDSANINQNHWVAVVLGFAAGQMNTSNTTAGGLSGSAMYTWLTGDCKTTVLEAFGSAHLIANNRLLSNGTYNSSSVTHGFSWVWTSQADYACLMSEVQIYGSKVWSDLGWSTGEANRQLDVFRNASFMEVLGRNYGQSNNNFNSSNAWLRDISAYSPGTLFCSAYYSGRAYNANASDSLGRYPIINLK